MNTKDIQALIFPIEISNSKHVEKESSKKDGSDTEEENLDEMSMSSFSTQKTGP